MSRANHLHRYRKVNLSRTKGKEYLVYQCIKPACSHYIPLQLAIGKLCECNRCGSPMLITKVQLNSSGGGPMARPHCTDCIDRKGKLDDTAISAISDFLGEKGT